MLLRDLFGDVFRTLRVHKLRTFLTMFGIARGMVSIRAHGRHRRGSAQRLGIQGPEFNRVK